MHTDQGNGKTIVPAREKLMRAIVQNSYGSFEVLQIAEIERPQIKDDEILVKVSAAGLDRGTEHLMTGTPYLIRLLGYGFRGPKNPVPGLDFSGTVEALGKNVTRFQLGDEVYGIGQGSFAEYVSVKEKKLALRPTNLELQTAAAVPVSAITALEAVRDHGRLEAGQSVMVIGASGGVGTYAVQIAKALGAHVTGVCSTSKMELVQSLGAERIIDYTKEDFADGQTQYDLIVDIGGNTQTAKLRKALSPKGTLVFVGGEEGGRIIGGIGRQIMAVILSPFRKQRFAMFVGSESAAALEQVTRMIEQGQITPFVGAKFSLEQAPEAMRQLANGEARGKTIITV